MGSEEQGLIASSSGSGFPHHNTLAGGIAKALAIAGSGLGLAAALMACNSTVSAITSAGPNTQPAYFLLRNSGSLSATVIVDLPVPLQTHVAVNSCRSLSLQVPKTDSVKVVVTDSTTTTPTTYTVPFFEAGVWALDCAPGHGGPIALSSIGQVPC